MQYPGGKGRSYQRLISLIPPHRVYIETHLGGGAVIRTKRPADRNIGVEIDGAVVAEWRRWKLPDMEIVEGDAVSYLENYRWEGEEFVFCDPPYLVGTRRRAKVYRHDYDESDHRRLLSVLKSIPCKVMLAGYPSELYTKELAGWNLSKYLTRTHAGAAVEALWINYDVPTVLHDHNHMGYGFRQREAIRRRRASLVHRIEALDAGERSALYFELAQTDTALFAAAAEMIDG